MMPHSSKGNGSLTLGLGTTLCRLYRSGSALAPVLIVSIDIELYLVRVCVDELVTLWPDSCRGLLFLRLPSRIPIFVDLSLLCFTNLSLTDSPFLNPGTSQYGACCGITHLVHLYHLTTQQFSQQRHKNWAPHRL